MPMVAAKGEWKLTHVQLVSMQIRKSSKGKKKQKRKARVMEPVKPIIDKWIKEDLKKKKKYQRTAKKMYEQLRDFHIALQGQTALYARLCIQKKKGIKGIDDRSSLTS